MSSNIDGVPAELKPHIQKFVDIFSEELPEVLPPLKDIQHHIDIVPR